ncbi:MAG: HEAT repeat domain-containing protein [Pyrinomonadaceae bacterium]|nr:HEAT repeat domain-containing protein [Phycisphaerales bacterium]
MPHHEPPISTGSARVSPLTKRGSRAARARGRFFRLLAGAAVLACGGLLTGCIPQETANQMAQSDSVLGPLFNKPSERDAVAWANDEFNADKRARGTAMLANSANGDNPKYVDYLYVKHLADPDASVRSVAAIALALHGTPDNVPQLIPLLKDKDRSVRRSALVALQRLHNPLAVTALLEAADPAIEFESSVRAEAVDALGQYPEQRVLQRLIAALDDPQLIVNQAAHSSLRTLTGQDMPADRRLWAGWAKDNSSPFAARTAYTYPAFSRERFWSEYLPFISPPPNEEAGQPIGAPPV